MKCNRAIIFASGVLLSNAAIGLEEIGLKIGVNGNFLHRKLRMPGDSPEKEEKFYIGPSASLSLNNESLFFEASSSFGASKKERGKKGNAKVLIGVPFFVGNACLVPYAGLGAQYMTSIEKENAIEGFRVSGGKVRNRVLDYYFPIGFFVDFEKDQDLMVSPFAEYHFAIKSKDRHEFKLEPRNISGQIERKSKGCGYSFGFRVMINQIEIKPFVTFWELKEKHVTAKFGPNFHRENKKSKERRIDSGIGISYSF